jgi:hypothetical protein
MISPGSKPTTIRAKTQSLGDNSTLIATDAFVQNQINSEAVIMSKVLIAGHSFAMPLTNVMNAGFGTGGFYFNGGTLKDRGQWPNMVQDITGISWEGKFIYVSIPPIVAATSFTTYVPVPEDCWVDAASYFPGATITANATNYRSWSIAVPASQFSGTYNTIGIINSASANVTGAAENTIINFTKVNDGGGNNPAQGYNSAVGTPTTSLALVAGNKLIRVQSTPSGAGVADPGGTLVIRLSGRFRNYAVGGSQHELSGIYQGGWATSMNPAVSPKNAFPQNFAPLINLTSKFASTQTTGSGTISTVSSTVNVSSTIDFAASGTFSLYTNGGAQTVTYTGTTATSFTGCTIASGSQTYNSGFQACNTTIACQSTTTPMIGGYVIFQNNTVVTLTAINGAGATSLACAAVSGGNVAGTAAVNTQGVQSALQVPYSYEYMTGPGSSILMTGINDAGSLTMDSVAFGEALRAWAAFQTCSATYFNMSPLDSNIVTVAGNGAAATWAAKVQPASGQYGGAVQSFTGAVGATPPTITINLTNQYDGGTIDLFFLAWAGASKGGAATIKVDGATPPQGSVTVNTTGASATANQQTFTYSVNGTTTLTRTSGTFNSSADLGRLITGSGIPANTYISAIATGGATCTLSNSASTTTTGTATIYGCVPMVKRITGLTANVAHVITITLTSMAATDGTATFNFMGYGFEPYTTLYTPVLICNVAKIPSTTAYFVGNTDTNVNTLNAVISGVVAGTQAPISGNTQEPALPTTTIVCDINTALNKNLIYFSNDGLHTNTLGHTVIAKTVLDSIRGLITQQQAASR